ncbi:MAG: glycosyltransferase family 39 protein [Chthoniobacterales bacterium]|nr:glycosyltransferase family 39 protein [Chthoniobacterales bacterium]
MIHPSQAKSFLTHHRLPLLGALIVLVTLFRFWYSTQLELTGDEAYYWFCSHHLDWSFFDKGPGAALTIFFGRHLFGDTVFGVRFFAVLLSAATGIGLYALARMLYSEKAACWTLIIVLFIPLYAVGSILMTIDPLSIFFWTMAAIAFWKAKESQRGLALWILTGALVGLGMLAKYTNLIELLCFALFCLWIPSQRYRLKTAPFYLMLLTVLVFALPMIIWNAQHHWIGVVHLIKRGDLDKAWCIRPDQFLTFIGVQAGVISPFFFLGIMTAVFSPTFFQKEKEATYYLLSLFLPLFLVYGILSLNKTAEPNWPAPCYVAGIILLAGNWDAFVKRFPWAKKLVSSAIIIAAIETILLHNTFWLHLPIPSAWHKQAGPTVGKVLNWYEEIGKVDPLDRAHGTVSIVQHAQQVAKEQGTAFFISDNYQTASLFTFYLPGHPMTYEPSSRGIRDQFSIWPGYRETYPEGSKALFVYAWPKYPDDLVRDFSSIELIDVAPAMDGKRPIRDYYYSVCSALR